MSLVTIQVTIDNIWFKTIKFDPQDAPVTFELVGSCLERAHGQLLYSITRIANGVDIGPGTIMRVGDYECCCQKGITV